MHGVSDLSSAQDCLAPEGLPSEIAFYGSYSWCLRPHVTVGEAIVHLDGELAKLASVPADWRRAEVTTNVFLLSCAILNCADEHLRGATLRLPTRLATTIIGRAATRFVEVVSDEPWSRKALHRWRQQWLAGIHGFLLLMLRPQCAPEHLIEAGRKLITLLNSPLPETLRALRIGTPTPFSRLDLTQEDFLTLGKGFARRYPDRHRPIVITGLRSSGSYFAPLLRAFLQLNGYENLALLTVEPNKGISHREMKEFKGFAERGYLALIVDDPPHTNRTLLAALNAAQRAGFAPENLKFLVPTHSSRREWFKAFPEDSVITLAPEQWYKRALLDDLNAVKERLAEYFHAENLNNLSIVESDRARDINAGLQELLRDERGARLKKVFEIQLERSPGQREKRFVLAKSVGWGWLGYHTFLIGQKLTGYVPSILGLRDGILYMQWIPHRKDQPLKERRKSIETFAAYTAARVRNLGLGRGLTTGRDLKRYDDGTRLLEKVLSQAYGGFPVGMLMQSRLAKLLRRQAFCPFPALMDGKMDSGEWVYGTSGLIKADFEHHGMGKSSLNVTDPAFDLAATILNFSLSPAEEKALLRRYIADSGDETIERRLFMHKLLAGISALKIAHEQLFASRRGKEAQDELHRQFMQAWNFLTVEAARYCGALGHRGEKQKWNAPIVVLDIDGVIDRRVFGFPSTTAAGAEALSLLRENNFSVAVNTARSASEVRDYCRAYSLAGGIAEHGSYIWDAVAEQERVLISSETARQLEELRNRLRDVPGVFLDERHRYSIRAFTYREKPLGIIQSLLSAARSSAIGDGAVGPISTHIIHQLLEDMGLNRLTFHHTMIDTTVVAKESDKGTGLIALRDWVLTKDAETIAVGDTEHDLSMFRVATRSFAPSNIGCKGQARLFGCHIARYPYQRGLLEIVEKILLSRGSQKKHGAREAVKSYDDDLFMTILRAADESRRKNLLRAVFHPDAFRIFTR